MPYRHIFSLCSPCVVTLKAYIIIAQSLHAYSHCAVPVYIPWRHILCSTCVLIRKAYILILLSLYIPVHAFKAYILTVQSLCCYSEGIYYHCAVPACIPWNHIVLSLCAYSESIYSHFAIPVCLLWRHIFSLCSPSVIVLKPYILSAVSVCILWRHIFLLCSPCVLTLKAYILILHFLCAYREGIYSHCAVPVWLSWSDMF